MDTQQPKAVAQTTAVVRSNIVRVFDGVFARSARHTGRRWKSRGKRSDDLTRRWVTLRDENDDSFGAVEGFTLRTDGRTGDDETIATK